MSSINRGATIPGKPDGKGGWLYEPVHPEHAYIDERGYRSLDMEASVREGDGGVIVYDDTLDRNEPIAVQLNLTAEGVEWLLEQLDKHRTDRFVRGLAYARDLAKVIAWDRATGSVV